MTGINYEQLKTQKNNLDSIIDDMVDQAKKAKEIINKMDNNDHWDGNGYNEYKNKFGALISNFGEYCNGLYKLNNNIDVSIQNYKKVDKKVLKQNKG